MSGISGINFANAVTSIGVLTVFVLPLTQEFGWSRTQISAATSLGAVLGAVAAPFTGHFTDRFGARVLLAAAGVMIGLGILYLSLMQTLLGFYVAFSLVRLADQGLVQAVSPPAVAKWFLRYRARALTVLFFATAAGGVVLPPLAQLVITQWGWRGAWALLSGIMLVIGLIPCALFVRRQPEDMGLPVDGQQVGRPMAASPPHPVNVDDLSASLDETHWRFGDAVKTTALWALLVSTFTAGVVSTGVTLHLVPYLVQQGLASGLAVAAVSVGFVAAGVSTLWWGFLCERFSARYVLSFILGVKAFSVVLLMAVNTPAEMYLFATLSGFTEGGTAMVATILLADYYGRRYLGSIYGLNRAVRAWGFALGPLISGVVFDITGTYDGAFISFIFLAIGGAVLVAAARPPLKAHNLQ